MYSKITYVTFEGTKNSFSLLCKLGRGKSPVVAIPDFLTILLFINSGCHGTQYGYVLL